MSNDSLENISAVDGRYYKKTKPIAKFTSERALFGYRVEAECKWFLHLANNMNLKELPSLSDKETRHIQSISENFSLTDAQRIKAIEETTNHDVKATEYFVKERMEELPKLAKNIEFVHFGCTSEDINNIAYALMLSDCRNTLGETVTRVIKAIDTLASSCGDTAMISRTHGQTASPSTMKKELAVFAERLIVQLERLNSVIILAKMNGAVGNFNAHQIAYPEFDWLTESNNFIKSLGLTPIELTTQIEPHDYIAEYFHCFIRLNQIMLDFNQDIWHYISLDYFEQQRIVTETGSSTMPHKVNPIDFENSEGNLGIANALLSHMANKLQISRWQRDLSDSTVLRNIGSALAHCHLAYNSAVKGLSKLAVNKTAMSSDLDKNWAVLAEAIQTIMRRYGLPEPYEQIKNLTRGKPLTEDTYHELLNGLKGLPKDARETLELLRPENYIGLASKLGNRKARTKQ